ALELARIRHAGGRLALLRALRAARDQADARHRRAHLRGLRPRRRGSQTPALGVHGPRLRPDPDSQGRGSGGDDQSVHGHPRALQRRPGLTQTLETPELLVGAGVKYIGDWVYDDEPTVIRTAKGPLVTLPYTVEINDIGIMIVQHHESEYLAKRAIDQFDRLYAEGKSRAKIMA